MNDVDKLLENDAAAWQRSIDGGRTAPTDDRAERQAAPRRPRVGTLLSAAAAVIIVVAGTAFVAHSRTNQSAKSPTLTSRTYEGLTISFPNEWKVLNPSFNTAGVDAPVAYLTDAAVSDQCPGGSCQGPVSQLKPGQIFVTILEEPDVSVVGRPQGVVAGHPAVIRTGADATLLAACPAGATQYLYADVTIQAQAAGLGIHACVGASGTAQIKTMRRVLETARSK